MRKKSIKQKTYTSTPEYDSRRQQNVLLEDMSKKINTIAEGHSIIIQKLDGVESELGTVKHAVFEVDGKLKKVEYALNTVEHRLDGVECKLNTVEHKLESVDCKLDTVAVNHEQRIEELEAAK